MTDVIYESFLDKRWKCTVVRTGEGTGELSVIDTTGDKGEVMKESVSLAFGAAFGPDVADVADWEAKIVSKIDGLE